MRAAAALLLGAPLLFSCAGDARHARVELDLRTEPCASKDPVDCTVHLVGSGLIFTAGSETEGAEAGTDTLYAEIETSSGALALIEIGLLDRGIRHIRYREVMDGLVSLKARVEDSRLKVPLEGTWQFSFDAVDADAPEGTAPARVITNGLVLPHDGDVRTRVSDASGSGGGSKDGSGGSDGTHVVVILDGYTPPRREADPGPDRGPDQPRRRRSEPDMPVYDDSSGGCDSDPDYDSGGCGGSSPDYDSGGGCEGDSSGGGCDGGGGDTGGCEGDTADSAGDCDSCEGDVAMRADLPPEVRRRRAILSMLRLSWPVWIAGWFNRKKRRRRPSLDEV